MTLSCRRAVVLAVLRATRRVQLDEHADAVLQAPLQRLVDVLVGALNKGRSFVLCREAMNG